MALHSELVFQQAPKIEYSWGDFIHTQCRKRPTKFCHHPANPLFCKEKDIVLLNCQLTTPGEREKGMQPWLKLALKNKGHTRYTAGRNS